MERRSQDPENRYPAVPQALPAEEVQVRIPALGYYFVYAKGGFVPFRSGGLGREETRAEMRVKCSSG